MKDSQSDPLSRFGFSFAKGGVHTSRTIMIEELELLFDAVAESEASQNAYLSAIIDDNCLKKRSVKTRRLTAGHLTSLYALDPSITLFRGLRFFWQRDPVSRPLIALLCAYARDPILKSSAACIINIAEGKAVTRESLEAFLEKKHFGRFSKATLKSTAQNINASFTKSGHLVGKAKKIRTRAVTASGAAAYALLLGYLEGARGSELFNSEYIRLLECPVQRAFELTEDASRKGWLIFKRIGDVMEVLFPNLLTSQEMEWIREQN